MSYEQLIKELKKESDVVTQSDHKSHQNFDQLLYGASFECSRVRYFQTLKASMCLFDDITMVNFNSNTLANTMIVLLVPFIVFIFIFVKRQVKRVLQLGLEASTTSTKFIFLLGWIIRICCSSRYRQNVWHHLKALLLPGIYVNMDGTVDLWNVTEYEKISMEAYVKALAKAVKYPEGKNAAKYFVDRKRKVNKDEDLSRL